MVLVSTTGVPKFMCLACIRGKGAPPEMVGSQVLSQASGAVGISLIYPNTSQRPSSCVVVQPFREIRALLAPSFWVSSFSGTLSSCLLASSFPPPKSCSATLSFLLVCPLCARSQSSTTHRHPPLPRRTHASRQARHRNSLSRFLPTSNPRRPSHVLLHDSPPSGPHETSTTMAKGRVWRCRPSSHHLRHRPRTWAYCASHPCWTYTLPRLPTRGQPRRPKMQALA